MPQLPGKESSPHKPPIVHLGRGRSTSCFKPLIHRVFHMGPSMVGRIRSLRAGGASGCPVWAKLGWAGPGWLGWVRGGWRWGFWPPVPPGWLLTLARSIHPALAPTPTPAGGGLWPQPRPGSGLQPSASQAGPSPSYPGTGPATSLPQLAQRHALRQRHHAPGHPGPGAPVPGRLPGQRDAQPGVQARRRRVPEPGLQAPSAALRVRLPQQ